MVRNNFLPMAEPLDRLRRCLWIKVNRDGAIPKTNYRQCRGARTTKWVAYYGVVITRRGEHPLGQFERHCRRVVSIVAARDAPLH